MSKNSSRSKKPLVSIIIITKNQKVHLEKTLPVIFNQTLKDFEVIIVDSGSADGALEVMKKYPVKIHHTNQPDLSQFNHARAFNEGAKKAKGKLLVRLSGDAVPVDQNWLKNLIKGLEKKEVAATCGSYVFSTRADLLFQFWFRPSFRFLRRGKLTSFTGGNCALKQSCWKKYPLNESFGPGEDWEWSEILKAKGFKIIFNPKAKAHHEHRSGLKGNLRDIWWWLTNTPVQYLKVYLRKRQL